MEQQLDPKNNKYLNGDNAGKNNMALDYKTIIIAKPEVYDGITKESAVALFKADQEVQGAVKAALIDRGIQQLKERTGYTNSHLPSSSPVDAEPFSLDGITFKLFTTVRRNNPQYEPAYAKIQGFLELLDKDWRNEVRKDGVRGYLNEATGAKEPFVRWDYLLSNVYDYISQGVKLGVENKFKDVIAPNDLQQSLDRLVIPVAVMENFDIQRPGAARLWYQACHFYEDVAKKTVEPFKKELEGRAERAGELEEEEEVVTRLGFIERMPAATQEHWEQVADYLFKVQRVPSPRSEPGKALKRIFAVPEKKEKGELPVVITGENYQEMLKAFKPNVAKSLPRWKVIENYMGELVTFYYGVDTDAKVQEQFPFLPEYRVVKDDKDLFVRVRAVHARMQALEQDYSKNRLLTRHDVRPLV